MCFDQIQQHQFLYTFKLGAVTEKESPESVADDEPWSLEEKDRLFQFVTKVFLMNLPMYMAYKHSVNTSLEELSQQEAAALNNYCELSVSRRLILFILFVFGAHWTCHFATGNVNKVNIYCGIVLIIVASCYFWCTL